MPSKSRLYLSLGTILAVAVIFVGGYFLWNYFSSKPKQPQKIDLSSSTSDNKQKSSNTGSSAGSFTLNSANGDQLTQSQSSSSNSSSSSSNSSSSSDSSDQAAQLLNPSTFAQYNKYIDAPNTMYIDLLDGSGTELTSGHQAAVYYKGWLTNGKLFDESQEKNGQLQPFVFTLGEHQVIPGWEEGLDGMKVGGVRLLIIPPALGYGAAGQGPIPGNSVLIFQVQLAAVQ